MAKDRLVVEEERGAYFIGWFLAEGQEMGAFLGEGQDYAEAELKAADPDDYEAVLAEFTSRKLWGQGSSDGSDGNPYRSQSGGRYYWETRSQAEKALRALKVRMQSAQAEKPWPEWAIKAKEAGWKPPRGWKP